MTHDEARLLLGATPGEVSAPLAQHLAGCPECTLFQDQMQRMDQDLARLLSAAPPLRASAPVLILPIRAPRKSSSTRQTPGLMALAASIVVSIAAGLLFWTMRPQASLAAGVVGHVALEQGSWSQVEPMTAAATDSVLAGAGVALDTTDTTVTYARSCLFNGHWVPHLIVRTAAGPVTLLVLREEHVPARQSFRQNGYSGILVPNPSGGTLAVITRGNPDLDEVARALAPHLRWAP